MRTNIIYKYQLIKNHGEDYCKIDMPMNAKIIDFDYQVNRGEGFYLWALVNLDDTIGPRYFRIVATGERLQYSFGKIKGAKLTDCENIYIKTCFIHGFVWHLFELEP